MRWAALATVLLFLGQAGVCAHAGFGAAAVFGGLPAVKAGGCARASASHATPDAAEYPAQRCERHCAQYAKSVPAAAPQPALSALLSLPVAHRADVLPPFVVAVPPAPERAPPAAPIRLRIASLLI